MDHKKTSATANGLTKPQSRARTLTAPTAVKSRHSEAPASFGGRPRIDDVVGAIGPKVWSLRTRTGLTPQQLAHHAHVSPAVIDKIEHNATVPTVTTLLKIAAVLNCRLSYFTEEEDPETGPTTVFIPGSGQARAGTSRPGVELRDISGPHGRFFVTAACAAIQPGASSGDRPLRHPGEELIYLFEGYLEVSVDGTTFLMGPGDALHFRANGVHRWHNPGDIPARALWMTVGSACMDLA